MSVLMSTLATKVVVGILAGGIAVTGAGAVYASTLPAAWQPNANDTVGAPAPTTLTEVDETPATNAEAEAEDTDSSTTLKPTPVGPEATGPAAHGLCTAFAHGGLSSQSTAYAALVEASGDESGIDGYCATVAVPGASKDDSSSTTPDPSAPAPKEKDKGSAHKPEHAPGKSGTKHNK